MRRRVLAVVAAGAAIGPPAAALAQHGDHGMPAAGLVAGPAVSIGFDDYTPPLIDVVTGDTVTWTNNSVRAHTVVARDGSWASARMVQGDRYAQRFAVAGAYPYFCTLHVGMAGEVDAHDVLLTAPATPAGAGRPYPLSGRSAAAPGTAVTIEADDGAGYVRAAQATVGADGTFAATVTPRTTAAYRAVVPGAEASPPVQLIVLDHTVTVSVRQRGPLSVVTTQVSPPDPGANVVLQLRLKNRFGWWPERFARLDAASRATFTIRPPVPGAPARVLLTLADRATALAESPVVRLRGGTRR